MLLSNENDVQTTLEKKYPYVDHESFSPLVGAYFLTLRIMLQKPCWVTCASRGSNSKGANMNTLWHSRATHLSHVLPYESNLRFLCLTIQIHVSFMYLSPRKTPVETAV